MKIFKLFVVFTWFASAFLAAQEADDNRRGDRENRVSPVRRIERSPEQPRPQPPPPNAPFRAIDGSGNNLSDPLIGSTGIQLLRMMSPDYADGVAKMAGEERANPRSVSNTVAAQVGSRPAPNGATDFLWQWGQFLDHDIDLTDGIDPPEPANIAIPAGDPWFDPNGSGTVEMSFNRSIYDHDSGTATGNPRQQTNEITAWIDASNVYGSDETRAEALRTMDGTGRLKTSSGNMLPFNTAGLPNAGGPSDQLFLAGDVRANEQVGLAAMHTLFVREHNRIADQIRSREPNLSGTEIYERARRFVGAEMQAITYREFLPILLGSMAPRPYRGYREDVDASIANAFSTAAYRFGHSALNGEIKRLDENLQPIPQGNLPLRNAFFAPFRLTTEGGIDPILRGLSQQVCQNIDPFVIDDVRNFLFGQPGSGGFDLVSLNIQRGRDHGLPTYNDARRAWGLQPARGFNDITRNREIADRLRRAYGDVEDVDLWVGGLAEDPVDGAMVGRLFALILRDQFEALRDGDRFWYERTLNDRERRDVEQSTLGDIIRRNTGIGNEIGRNVFILDRPN